ADALGADLDRRLDVLHGLGEDVDGVEVGHALLDLVHRAIEDTHRGRLLAAPHEAVDELGRELGAVAWIGLQGIGAGGAFLAGHVSWNLGRLSYSCILRYLGRRGSAPLRMRDHVPRQGTLSFIRSSVEPAQSRISSARAPASGPRSPARL